MKENFQGSSKQKISFLMTLESKKKQTISILTWTKNIMSGQMVKSDMYTQSGLIRNGGIFQPVGFLKFWAILYSFCFLTFQFHMVSVSYIFQESMRSLFYFFKIKALVHL